MFDANRFKKQVKEWIRVNPDGSLSDMLDFCEDQIPPAQYSSYQWLIEQTSDWYKHILAQREMSTHYDHDQEDDQFIA